jgi:hypothetical protein
MREGGREWLAELSRKERKKGERSDPTSLLAPPTTTFQGHITLLPDI